jgi:hypothetical protein
MSVLEINGKDEIKASLMRACESILRGEDDAIVDLVTMFGLATVQADIFLDEETARLVARAGVSVIERLDLSMEYMALEMRYIENKEVKH